MTTETKLLTRTQLAAMPSIDDYTRRHIEALITEVEAARAERDERQRLFVEEAQQRAVAIRERDEARAERDGHAADAEALREVMRHVKVRIAFIGHPNEPWRGERDASRPEAREHSVQHFLSDHGPDWADVIERMERVLTVTREPTAQILSMTRGHAEAYASACAGWIRGEGVPPRGEVAAALAEARSERARLAVEAQAMREALTALLSDHLDSGWSGGDSIAIDKARAALSAPSESERVLRERDAKRDNVWLSALEAKPCDAPLAARGVFDAVMARDAKVRARAEADLNAEWRAIQEPGEHPDEADSIARHDAKVRADERAKVMAVLHDDETPRPEWMTDAIDEFTGRVWNEARDTFANELRLGGWVAHDREVRAAALEPMREVARELWNETARQVVTPRTRDLLRALLGMDEMGRPAPSAASGKCAMCGGTKLVRNTHVPRLDDPEWWPCPTCAASEKGGA